MPYKLFEPIKVGDITLQHRVIHAPLTRIRANKKHVHGDLAVQYYGQRATVPGTLLITEGTFIAAKAGGVENVPALETDEQLVAWKRVTDAVHANNSFIFAQLWALGRAAHPSVIEREGLELIGASDIPLKNNPKPRPLTTAEVKEFIQLYAKAAANAMYRANFDGVEIHSANGFLVAQFLHETVNNRTDEYGGSIENRSRFALEILDAVVKVVGPTRVGIRISPWEGFNDTRLPDPIPQYTYLVTKIAELFPTLAYLHVVEPRISNFKPRDPAQGESNDFLRNIWAPRPFVSAGGYNRDLAIESAETKGDIIAFGRWFISNPDLPYRLKANIPLTPYNRDTIYIAESPVGYIDYPFAQMSRL